MNIAPHHSRFGCLNDQKRGGRALPNFARPDDKVVDPPRLIHVPAMHTRIGVNTLKKFVEHSRLDSDYLLALEHLNAEQ